MKNILMSKKIKDTFCTMLAITFIGLKIFILNKEIKKLRKIFIILFSISFCIDMYNYFLRQILLEDILKISLLKICLCIFSGIIIGIIKFCLNEKNKQFKDKEFKRKEEMLSQLILAVNKVYYKKQKVDYLRFLDECQLAIIQQDITGIKKISQLIILTNKYNIQHTYFILPIKYLKRNKLCY